MFWQILTHCDRPGPAGHVSSKRPLVPDLVPTTMNSDCKGKTCKKHTYVSLRGLSETRVILTGAFQTTQGDTIQEGQRFALRTGKASLRPKAVWLRWSDQACLSQEGVL